MESDRNSVLDENEAIARLMGKDPVLGNQAVDFFAAQGSEALDRLIPILSEFTSDQVLHRLIRLFGKIGDAAVDSLLDTIEHGGWHAKVIAAKCFRDILSDIAKTKLGELLDHTNMDVRRCAVDALGYMGADSWAFKIQKVTFPSVYDFEKLRFHAAQAFTRMIAKETSDFDVFSDLLQFEAFLEAWKEIRAAIRISSREGKEKESVYFYMKSGLVKMTWEEELGQLSNAEVQDVTEVFTEFTPIVVDGITSRWLNHTDPLLREFAAEALGCVRLSRSIKPLAERFYDGREEINVRVQAAIALGQIGGQESITTLIRAYKTLDLSSEEKSRYGKTLRDAMHIALSERLYQIDDKNDLQIMIDELLQGDAHTKGQALYSLGILHEAPDRIVENLSSPDGFLRGSAALGLVRMEEKNALRKLRPLEKEATNPFERLLLFSSLVHAGLPEKAEDLHKALCDLPLEYRAVRQLKYIWQREILFALVSAGGKGIERAEAWADLMRVNLKQCIEEMEHINSQATPVSLEGKMADKKVFIVHGRNRQVRNEIDLFLTKLGLKTEILQAKPNLGKTLPEKFENIAAECQFAIFILTGDDQLLDPNTNKQIIRARQNVILEVGYFWGTLGRHGHVVFLVDKHPDMELPSDLQGIGWIPITEDLGDTKLRLMLELQAAGIL